MGSLYLPRRSVLRLGLTSTAAALASTALPAGGSAASSRPAKRYFRHGVASGDPLPDGVLLWTRVTPTADALPGSGQGPAVEVGWEVASDRNFRRIVARGTTRTDAASDHTVKVDVRGLAPGRQYSYRFTLGGVRSPIGRTRTAPSPLQPVSHLRLGVVSCANWQAGYFAAYRHLAARGDLDAVLHLGDYLYEYGPGEYGAAGATIRPHDPAHEMVSLADYRRRHAQYKTDPDLQALHAVAPWIVTWDDHETANDAWSGGAENHQPDEGSWAQRRAAALRAYAEWMPIRMNPGQPIYRRLRFGTLAELSMLDLRSYRSQQVAPTDLAGVDDPSRSITGAAQLGWLKDGLLVEDAQWKLVGNPVMIAPVQLPPLPASQTRAVTDTVGLLPSEGVAYNVDQWDGYTADRAAVFAHLADNGVTDTVFLTGDIHTTWACDLPLDAGLYPASRSVGVELVGPSVTSDNVDDILRTPPRTASLAVEDAIRATNRHVRHVELDSHGYAVLDLTPAAARMEWFYLNDRTARDSAAYSAAVAEVPAGTQRVASVTGALA